MRITPDANVLVRALVRDDAGQARSAERVLREATSIALTLPCLCELVWVLQSVYRHTAGDVAKAIRVLLETENVEANRPAVEAGLRMLESGGDFADGVIAYEGSWLGAEKFVSFDRNAVQLLVRQGVQAERL